MAGEFQSRERLGAGRAIHRERNTVVEKCGQSPCQPIMNVKRTRRHRRAYFAPISAYRVSSLITIFAFEGWLDA